MVAWILCFAFLVLSETGSTEGRPDVQVQMPTRTMFANDSADFCFASHVVQRFTECSRDPLMVMDDVGCRPPLRIKSPGPEKNKKNATTPSCGLRDFRSSPATMGKER